MRAKELTESGRYVENMADFDQVARFYRVLRNIEGSVEWYSDVERVKAQTLRSEAVRELEVLEAVLVDNIERLDVAILQSKADKAQELLGRIREALAKL